jgi:hypothetical protein
LTKNYIKVLSAANKKTPDLLSVFLELSGVVTDA